MSKKFTEWERRNLGQAKTAEEWVEQNLYRDSTVELFLGENYDPLYHSPWVIAKRRASGIFNVNKRALAISELTKMLTELFREVRGEEPLSQGEVIELESRIDLELILDEPEEAHDIFCPRCKVRVADATGSSILVNTADLGLVRLCYRCGARGQNEFLRKL